LIRERVVVNDMPVEYIELVIGHHCLKHINNYLAYAPAMRPFHGRPHVEARGRVTPGNHNNATITLNSDKFNNANFRLLTKP